MFDDAIGPIEHYEFGKFIICGNEHSSTEEGKAGVGKDIRLIGQEVTAWKERKGHLLTKSMITGVYDLGLEVLIIGTGAQGALQCPEEVQHKIRKKGIPELIVAPTPEACEKYNALYRQGKQVALLAHGTC